MQTEKPQNFHQSFRFGILEILLLLFFFLGLFLMYNQFPGGSVIIVISLSALSLLYFQFGFLIFNGIAFRKILKKESYTELTIMRFVSAIATGLGLSILILGFLFKLMSWPGSYMMLVSGVTLISIFLFITLIQYFRNNLPIYKNIITRTLFFGSIGYLLLALPSYTIAEIKYSKIHPSYITALKALEQDPTNKVLQEQVRIEAEKVFQQNIK